jgi:hypothetical protein
VGATDYQLFDRCQWDVTRLEDEFKKLAARVTALERGETLPAEQEFVPVPAPAPVVQPEQPATVSDTPDAAGAPEINVAAGQGMSAGPLRKN